MVELRYAGVMVDSYSSSFGGPSEQKMKQSQHVPYCSMFGEVHLSLATKVASFISRIAPVLFYGLKVVTVELSRLKTLNAGFHRLLRGCMGSKSKCLDIGRKTVCPHKVYFASHSSNLGTS